MIVLGKLEREYNKCSCLFYAHGSDFFLPEYLHNKVRKAMKIRV